jgi:hypothetical protein
MLLIVVIEIICHLLLALLHTVPHWFPEHHHRRLTGLVYLIGALSMAAGWWAGGH